jgi:hypothetical protein
MLDTLDIQALQHYSLGDFHRAIATMRRAVKIRTQTRVDFDSRTIALNIEFMADAYSRAREWERAHRTYQQAMVILQKRVSTQGESVDTIQLMDTITQKINCVQSMYPSNEAKEGNLLDI